MSSLMGHLIKTAPKTKTKRRTKKGTKKASEEKEKKDVPAPKKEKNSSKEAK